MSLDHTLSWGGLCTVGRQQHSRSLPTRSQDCSGQRLTWVTPGRGLTWGHPEQRAHLGSPRAEGLTWGHPGQMAHLTFRIDREKKSCTQWLGWWPPPKGVNMCDFQSHKAPTDQI